MTPADQTWVPLPDQLPAPAPEALLHWALVVAFFLHLVPMNLLLGGTWIALAARVRARWQGGENCRRLAAILAGTMPSILAATVTAGVAALLFLQVLYGRLFFASSVVMAGFWLAAVLAVIGAYAGSYMLASRGDRTTWGAVALNLGVGMLLLSVAAILAANMTRMLEPAAFAKEYLADGRGLHLVPASRTYLPRLAHMAVGAVGLAGAFVAILGRFRRRKETQFGDWMIRVGCVWLAGATVLELFSGIWWLVWLPREIMMRFMGGDVAATIVFSLGVFTSLLTLAAAGITAVAPRPAAFLPGTLGLLAVTLVTMVINRDQVRLGAVEALGLAARAPAGVQWGPIVLCGVLLVAGAVCIWWMLAALWRAHREEA